VWVWDDRYLALSCLVTFAWQMFFYILAAVFKVDKFTDLCYGSNFAALALLTFFLNGSYYPRQIFVTAAMTLWGIRLAGFLFYRILHIGHDKRFDGVRDNPIKFFIWFLFQFVVIWIVSLPFLILNSKDSNVPLQANDYVGWALFVIALVCESVGDHQKFTYRNDPKNKDHWCDVGLWKFSRHPNYFGEVLVWWSIFMTCATQLVDWEWFAVSSPIFMTIIMLFLSGIPTTEKATDERFWKNPEYVKWKKRTPVLIPFIPGVFTGAAKAIFCFEFPFYTQKYELSRESQSLKA